jgi:hypothetical protein
LHMMISTHKQARGFLYIFVLYVVSNVSASPKSAYSPCWLACDQNKLSIFPSPSNWKSQKNCGFCCLQ